MRIPQYLFLVALLTAPGLSAQAPTVQARYNDALAKEKAVRTALSGDLAAPAALKAVRTVVSDYEVVVRRYPSSSYSDDALWNAGQLSVLAFEKFGEAQDRSAAERLLRLLASEYPSSKWVKQAASQAAVLARTAPAAANISSTAAPLPRPVPSASAAAPRITTISRITREVFPEVVRVTIHMDGDVPYRDERLADPSRVFLDLSSVRLAPGLIDQTLRFDGDNQAVRQIRTGRHPNQTARIVLEAASVQTYNVYALQAPFRLVIDCVPMRAGTTARSVPVRVTPAPAPPPAVLQVRRLPPEATSPMPSIRSNLSEATSAARPEARTTAPAAAPIVPSRATTTAGTATVPPIAPITSVSANPAPTPAGPLPAEPVVPAVAVAPPSRNLAGGFSMARQLGLGVSRIVIDPGHGGHDPGAKGRGVNEAEVVLDVALRLEKLLIEVPGVDVILTRRTDEYVPLEQRTAIANRESADLFLSIHANASNNTQASGVETYFLNFASNLSAASVAARENAASGQAMGALPDFVKTIALNNKLDESKDFATYVQRAMIEALRPANKTVRDLGVKQAPFVVLIGAAMPSVLAEISFVTNSQDARLLKNGNYRQRIAEALFKAVQKYQASLKTVGKVALQ